LKYRLQLAALNQYLRQKREMEDNLQEKARDLVLNYSKLKNTIIDEVCSLYLQGIYCVSRISSLQEKELLMGKN